MRAPVLAAVLLTLGCGPQQVSVVMNAQNNSGQSGIATLTDLGASTKVVVIIHKSDVPDPEPVHLHPGRCGEIQVKITPKQVGATTLGLPSIAAPGVVSGVDPIGPTDGGVVYTSATLEIPFKQLTGGDYVINVHDSRDFALYVSCGNIN